MKHFLKVIVLNLSLSALIVIPTLGKNLIVIPTLDENQKIAVLPTARIISWYEGSYLPGNEGNCILFGYKHYGGIAGIFYNLEKLQPGDMEELMLIKT